MDNNRKDEILAKIKQGGKDEGIEHAVNQGAKLGNYYTELVGFPLFMLCVLTGQWIAAYAVFTLYCATDFGDFLGKYRFLKQKRYLIASIVFGVLGIGSAVLFLRDVGILIGWWG